MPATNTAMTALGNNIRARREKTGMSQRQAATKMRIQQATWNKIEIGERLPTLEQAKEIITLFRGELSELHLMWPDRFPAPPVRDEVAA